MRPHLLGLMLLLSTVGLQRGTVDRLLVSDGTVRTGTPVGLTVRGTNPCGAVRIDPGDGSTPVTHAITELPVTIRYTYQRPGTYQVRAEAMGNCDGVATARMRVTGPALSPTPDQDRKNMRFAGMDRDGDGVIVRSEWRGNDRSFREHDWNNDGVLSGDEVRPGAERPGRDADRDERDRALARFAELDRNGDGRIARAEWPFNRQSFNRADLNGDGELSRPELTRSEPRPVGTAGQIVRVDASQEWTDTGLYVTAGDRVIFTASGTVQLSANPDDVADPGGSRSGRRALRAPFPNLPAGGLLARIDRSSPMYIGDRATIVSALSTGRLYLGVNDDYFADNRGEYRVSVEIEPR